MTQASVLTVLFCNCVEWLMFSELYWVFVYIVSIRLILVGLFGPTRSWWEMQCSELVSQNFWLTVCSPTWPFSWSKRDISCDYGNNIPIMFNSHVPNIIHNSQNSCLTFNVGGYHHCFIILTHCTPLTLTHMTWKIVLFRLHLGQSTFKQHELKEAMKATSLCKDLETTTVKGVVISTITAIESCFLKNTKQKFSVCLEINASQKPMKCGATHVLHCFHIDWTSFVPNMTSNYQRGNK